MPLLNEQEACIESGGHYWIDVPLGENSKCGECGAVGALNVPPVNGRPFDATS